MVIYGIIFVIVVIYYEYYGDNDRQILQLLLVADARAARRVTPLKFPPFCKGGKVSLSTGGSTYLKPIHSLQQTHILRICGGGTKLERLF